MSRYLTAAAATRLAREAVYGAARFTTTPGSDCFLTRVRMDTLTEEARKRETTELRLLNLARDHFRALGYDATVISAGGTRGAAVRYMVKVVDLRLRADRIEEATQRRHEVMARELGYASVEDYLAAPGRAELIADPELSGYPAAETSEEPRPRYTVRKQSSGYAASESFYVYDLTKQGRVTVHAHRTRDAAQADADRLNAAEAEHRVNLADPAWVADRDAKLAAQGLAVDSSGELVRLEDARTETAVEQWGPNAVAVTREYDAAPSAEVLPYRLEQSAPAAWQVMDRQSPALWGTVQRVRESMRRDAEDGWTRWVAYRPDGSLVGRTDSLPGAARLLVPLSEQAQRTQAAGPAYGCVQHVDRGPECGPDCDELTARGDASVR